MWFHSVFTFWKSASLPRRRPRPSPNRQHGFRPRLEALEDRCLPSTLNVTNNADNGASGTLRWAIAQAQSGDTIDILTTQPIVLTHGELILNKNLTIEAPAGSPATISGNGSSRVFEVPGAYVYLDYLNITGGNGVAGNPNGNASLNGYGGGILNDGYDLTINDCTLSGNSATDGGGIYNSTGKYFGTTTWLGVANSTLSGNGTHSGGGIYNVSGYVNVTGSTVSDNSAADGGGIYSDGGLYYSGNVSVWSSFVSHNSATHQGGGIYNGTSGLGLAGSTVSDNSAQDGGGIYNRGGSVSVRGNAIAHNHATHQGGGLYNGSGWVSIYGGTAISGNSAANHGGGIYNGSGSVSLVRTLALPDVSGNTPDDICGTYTITTYHRPRSW